MKITNKHNLPETIYKAVCNDPYDKGKSDFSGTEILNSPRQIILGRRYYDQAEEDAMDRIWSLLGNSIHTILERINLEEELGIKDLIQEQRFYKKVGDYKLSGQVDLYIDGKIQDYKITSTWTIIYGSRLKEWEEQLNIYAWLMRQNGFEVKNLEIITILRDWSKTSAERDKNYPQAMVRTIPIKLWDQGQQRLFIEEKLKTIKAYIDVPDDELPECTAEEMWEQPTTYAVIKGDNKRATKVFNDVNELANNKHKYPGHRIEVRKGKRNRCDNYCAINKFCNQYKAYLSQQGD